MATQIDAMQDDNISQIKRFFGYDFKDRLVNSI